MRSLLIALLAASLWFIGDRLYRNHMVYREAICLLANRDVWYKDGATSNAATELPSYNVGTRKGTVIFINEQVMVDGRKEIAELGWSNSCLGSGVLIVTSSNSFLWRAPGGVSRKLNIPMDLNRIPIWWWLVGP